MELPSVKSEQKLYEINQPIPGWIWDGTNWARASGTCGIYERDEGNDDSLGTVIIHQDEINGEGFKYTLVEDPKTPATFFELVDCNEYECSLSAKLLPPVVLLLALVWMFN